MPTRPDTTDTPEDRRRHAVLSALLGSGLGPGLAQSMQRQAEERLSRLGTLPPNLLRWRQRAGRPPGASEPTDETLA